MQIKDTIYFFKKNAYWGAASKQYHGREHLTFLATWGENYREGVWKRSGGFRCSPLCKATEKGRFFYSSCHPALINQRQSTSTGSRFKTKLFPTKPLAGDFMLQASCHLGGNRGLVWQLTFWPQCFIPQLGSLFSIRRKLCHTAEGRGGDKDNVKPCCDPISIYYISFRHLWPGSV